MSEVSVSSQRLAQLIELCKKSMNELDQTSNKLLSQYKDLGSTWKDSKYKEFGDIINNCCTSLKKPLGEMQRAVVYLRELMSIIEEYESISLGSGGGTDNSLFGNFISSIRSSSATRSSIRDARNAEPRNLTSTQYGFESIIVNGEECRMYNKPYETANALIRNQGENSRNMSGTCGLCQCVNQLRMAGISNVTEDDVINVALGCSNNVRSGLDINNPDFNERGGTTSAGRQEILSRYNLQVDNVPVSNNRAIAVNQLAEAVASGHGVIVSADAGVLWNNCRYSGGGHAISLLSVSENGDRFIYSDTGTGEIGVISANNLGLALTGRPSNITRNIVR